MDIDARKTLIDTLTCPVTVYVRYHDKTDKKYEAMFASASHPMFADIQLNGQHSVRNISLYAHISATTVQAFHIGPKPVIVQVGKFYWCGIRGCIGRIGRTPERAYYNYRMSTWAHWGRQQHQVKELKVWKTAFVKR